MNALVVTALSLVVFSGDVDELIRDLHSRQVGTRRAALDQLARLGPSAAPATRSIVPLVLDASPRVRQAALDALAAICPELKAPIVTLLTDPDRSRRQAALDALAHRATRAEAAVPAVSICLTRALATPRTVRRNGLAASDSSAEREAEAAVRCLGAIAPRDETLLRPMIRLARSQPRTGAGRAAASYLAGMGEMVPTLRPRICPVLLDVLRVEGSVAAIDALARQGSDAKDALPLLRGLRLAANADIRAAAERAVLKIEAK